MTAWAKIILPLVMFGIGYAGARALSRPSGSNVSAGESLSQPTATVPRSLQKTARKRHGFEAHAARMSAGEAAMARGDFEALIVLGEKEIALNAWADADPVGLWEFMEAGGRERYGHVFGIDDKVFRNWFRLDPDAAVAALGGRWTRKMAIIDLLFDDDPAVVRAVGERLDKIAPGYRPQPGEHGSRHWRDGLSVVERMLSLPESSARTRLVTTAVAGWAERNWREAHDWAAAQPEPERTAMLRAILSPDGVVRLITSPGGVEWAADFLAQEDNRELRMRMGPSIAGAMAYDDPAAAMRWTGEHLGGVPRGHAISAILKRQLSTDRDAALATVDDLPPGGLRDQVGRSVIQSVLRSDPSLAYERALGELRRGFDIGRKDWGRVWSSLGRLDKDRVRQIAADPPQGVPPDFDRRLFRSLGFADDPVGTIRWARELGGDRGEAIAAGVLEGWRLSDPNEVRRWEEGQ